MSFAIEEMSVAELQSLNRRGLVRRHDIPEHMIWAGMKQRCVNSNNVSYVNYGARNITVCDAWAEDFWTFFHDVGRRPKTWLTLERIDNDKGYFPGNVVWATRKVQNNNQRRKRKLTREQVDEIRAMRGIATVTDLAFDYDVKPSVICAIQLNQKWRNSEIIEPPPRIIPRAVGEQNALAILTEEQVLQVRMLLEAGYRVASIGRVFNVTASMIGHIKQGRNWRHVQLPDNWQELLAQDNPFTKRGTMERRSLA